MSPRDNEATQPSQPVSAWYGKVKPRVCMPNPTPQVLQQQVMYKPRKQKRAKVKAPATATQDTIRYQKVMEKLSAPRIKYQTTRMMREAQDMHNNGCQSVLRDRHYDGIWYRRVGKWLHYMEKTY